jgi:peptide/nickel transport system ATP-binding protein
MNLLVRLQDELTLAYVFISHDLGMVRHISDEIEVMYLGRVVERGPYDRVLDHALHPYTRALAAAVPVPDPALARRARAEAIGEQPALAADVPEGCPYRPRCPLAEAVCTHVDPPLLELEPHHGAACHVAAREAGVEAASVEAAAAR